MKDVYMNPYIWLTVWSVVCALLIAMRGFTRLRNEVATRTIIALSCFLSACIVFPGAIPAVVPFGVAVLVVLLVTTALCVDVSVRIFARIRTQFFNNDAFRKPLPPYLLEICTAMELLASKRIGALIIIEKKDDLKPFIGGGIPFDAQIKAEIITALFAKTSPVHDGAVIVSQGRIEKVKAILPLSTSVGLPMGIGTRHRSAIGITERTDAIALVASEERGELSVAYQGSLIKPRTHKELLKLVYAMLKRKKHRIAVDSVSHDAKK